MGTTTPSSRPRRQGHHRVQQIRAEMCHQMRIRRRNHRPTRRSGSQRPLRKPAAWNHGFVMPIWSQLRRGTRPCGEVHALSCLTTGREPGRGGTEPRRGTVQACRVSPAVRVHALSCLTTGREPGAAGTEPRRGRHRAPPRRPASPGSAGTEPRRGRRRAPARQPPATSSGAAPELAIARRAVRPLVRYAA